MYFDFVQHSHKFFTSMLLFYHCPIFTPFFTRISWKGIQINVTCLVPYGTVKGKRIIYNSAMFTKNYTVILTILFISG